MKIRINWTSLVSENTRKKWLRELEEELESVDPLTSWEAIQGKIMAKARKWLKLPAPKLDTRV